MKLAKLNILIGAAFLMIGGFGGFLLGGTLEGAMKDGVYMMPFVRIFFRGSHTHGLLIALYNIVYGMLILNIGLSVRSGKIGSYIAAGALLLPIGLGLRGLTGGAMTFAPIALAGGLLFIISAGFLIAGCIKKEE